MKELIVKYEKTYYNSKNEKYQKNNNMKNSK
jgi:hypothetical protein